MLEKRDRFHADKGLSGRHQGVRKNHTLVDKLINAIQASKPSVCSERAMLLTEFNKKYGKQFSSIHLERAHALRHVLENKQTIIYPDERLIGNFTSKRVGAPFYPEMVGLVMLSDYYNPFTARKMPLYFPLPERFRVLFKIFPYWARRNILVKAFVPETKNPFHIIKGAKDLIAYAKAQLNPKTHFINEVGGIIHLIPDYEGLVNKGIKGYCEDIRQAYQNAGNDDQRDFLKSIEVAAGGVLKMAANYAQEAEKAARQEKNGSPRKEELLEIARICRKVPYNPAETLHEALQAILFLHIAFVQQTLDMSISFGRMDQYLYPLYQNEVKKYAENNHLSRAKAKPFVNSEVQQLLECFFLKTNEVLPLYNYLVSRAHEGLPSFYAVTIGGVKPDGKDGVNDLTQIFLDVIKKIPLRQPNYHVRYSEASKPQFLEDVVRVIKQTGFTPALINDEAIIPTIQKHLQNLNGLSAVKALHAARNYGTIGCVETGIPGKSYPMADAAFFNLPICLVDALLKEEYQNVFALDELKKAFEREVRIHVGLMIEELQRIERSRRDYYPLPLVSLMVKGCVDKLKDVTAGGAQYNWSSIQAIGLADTVDCFAAIEKSLQDGIPLQALRAAIRTDFQNKEKLHQALSNAPKFGQDDMQADQFLDFVLDCYTSALRNSGQNARGGCYVAGGFSSGAHQLFGRKTSALPSGRRSGVRLANGVSPTDCADSLVITQTMNSVSRLNPKYYVNGYTFNQKVDPPLMENSKLFAGLLRAFFRQNHKGIQIQFNVIDEKTLKAARSNPEKYPWLVVRVSGYSAYFKDLSPQMKDEIIQRAAKRS